MLLNLVWSLVICVNDAFCKGTIGVPTAECTDTLFKYLRSAYEFTKVPALNNGHRQGLRL